MLAGFWTGGTGCSIETLAELMGDTPATTFNHYGREWGQHYQAPLWAAIGAGKISTRTTKKARSANGLKKDESPGRRESVPAKESQRRTKSGKRLLTAHG